MKSRIILLSAALVGVFVFVTSRSAMPDSWLGQMIHGKPGGTGGFSRLWDGPNVARTAGLSADELNSIDIYKAANTATVNISATTYQYDWFNRAVPTGSIGSGFLINDNGQILTNYHVVGQIGTAPGAKLSVTLADKSKYEARVLDKDPANDLALIQIEPRKKLTHLRLGDSDNLQVGQKVLAIGNPFGFEGSLTTGIVSAVGRAIRDENGGEMEGLIQTDAAINSGNSGGPLLNSAGDVIGINTAILGVTGGNIGIGFAMPISRARRMLDDFAAGHTYAPPQRLGVNVMPISGELAQALDLPVEGGLLVSKVVPGSAAALGGLRGGNREVVIGNAIILIGGDLITAVDGKPVERADAIPRALARKRAGETLELTVYRGGKSVKLSLKLLASRAEDRL